jgi:hypothetical protein
VETTVRKYRPRARRKGRKSAPFAVRLPPSLAEWVERYAAENGLMKTEVFEAALEKMRKIEGRKLNGKKKIILDAIKRADDGTID